MSSIFGGTRQTSAPPPTTTVAPVVTVDDATSRLNEQDKLSRRQGRKSTILTSDGGLPDLGTTTRTGQ